MNSNNKPKPENTRRDFMKKSALIGTGLVLAKPINIIANPMFSKQKVNVGVVGCGSRGRGVIFSNIPKIESANLVAVCDIVKNRREGAKRRFERKYDTKVNAYEDFYDMIAKEKLDAVVLTTPDFWHMQHTVDALESGLHVYCEKAMSNNLKDAKKMAKAMKKTGKLLQIGRQRRSNDRYRFMYSKLIQQEKIFGNLTHAIGQWNRSKIYSFPKSRQEALDMTVMKKYGFDNQDQVYNWRNYKKLGGGVVSDLGSHQIDIFNWFFNAYPHTVYATGNNSYYGLEQADTMATILEYDTPNGKAIGIYENISHSRAIGVNERFIGDKGAFIISEGKDNKIYRESRVNANEWQQYIDRGFLKNLSGLKGYKSKEQGDSGIKETAPQVSYEINEMQEMDKVYNLNSHTAHLYNFIEAIIGNEKLNYDAISSYKSELCIYKIHEAINGGGKKITIPKNAYNI
ncbi:Gfo/Idh/MocA family oxidoreductase [Spongiivirga sp. MCCC 1A20706]|uniref:Gfo/Idh/MocA family oxidoreductase n=1 Tax=Spongiivirga sp. MCCC 1A20706 TaxID=3160963 RepID=UPI003977B410